jgi:hypothetical protein
MDNNFFCPAVSEYSARWFYKYRFLCGRATLAFFKKILGLQDESALKLDSVAWKGYFEIRLLNRRAKEVFILAIKKYCREEEGLYEKYKNIRLDNDLVILFPKGEKSSRMIKLVTSLERNLSAIKPSDMFNMVYHDENRQFTQADPLSIPGGDARPNACRSFYDWGDSELGRTFMINYGSIVDIECWLDSIGHRRVSLACGDVECGRMENVFDFLPYDREYTFPKGRHIFRKTSIRDLITDFASFELKEEDIILGSDAKIYELLNKLTRRKDVPYVSILGTCINKIIGSDIVSLIGQINRKKSIEIDYSECNSGRQPEEFLDLMKAMLKAKGKQKARPRTVNLVGFENDRGMSELTGILKDIFAIELNLMPFPEVNFNTLKHFYRAKLQVLSSAEMYTDFTDDIFKDLDMPAMVLEPPYGMRRSAAWLRSIAGYFGAGAMINKKWKLFYGGKMARWEEMTREAGKYRLGFILSGPNADLLIDSSKYLFGIPLLKCLEEMGFGLNILITDHHDFEEQKDSILKRSDHKEKYRIELLNDPEKLEEWIYSTDCSCIYSDFRYDIKIISNGKVPFSLFVFEKGFDGAARTLERLLRLCRVGFFNAYKGYKQKPHPIAI